EEVLMTPNIADIIRHHVSLEARCIDIDRADVHASLPKLHTSGGLCYFLHDHLGDTIPSPALFPPMHDRFMAAVQPCAATHRIPTVAFEAGQDKDAFVAEYRARFTAREGDVHDRDGGPTFLKIGTDVPISSQALSQWARVGEAAAPPNARPLREPRQRIP